MSPKIVGLVFLVAALMAAGPAVAGRLAPVYNVVDHPIPAGAQALSLAEIERAIIAAGAQHQWQFDELAPGKLHATYSHGSHQVEVAVTFTQQAFSITLINTVNMKQSGDEVHRKYNEWVRTLEQSIAGRLTLAGLAAK